MRVKYNDVLGKTHIWTVFLLLFRWRGSVYKLVIVELLIYLLFYGVISVNYRYFIRDSNELKEKIFQFVVIYCQELLSSIPVAFVLGFYVSNVVTWWQTQYDSLPWPDDIALQLGAFMQGEHDDVLLMRRTIVRYINLGMVLAFRGISISALKRFPDLQSIQTSGLITAEEIRCLEEIDDTYNKFYVPIVWAANLLHKSRRKRYLSDDRQLDSMIENLAHFRKNLGDLFAHQWIGQPLVYTQVATITVYAYFFVSLFAWQFIDSAEDFYFPFFGMSQFLFYMGWLKVAENLLYPFGEDDDDFDIVYLIERNVQLAYLFVDEMHRKHPEVKPDDECDVGIRADLNEFTSQGKSDESDNKQKK